MEEKKYRYLADGSTKVYLNNLTPEEERELDIINEKASQAAKDDFWQITSKQGVIKQGYSGEPHLGRILQEGYKLLNGEKREAYGTPEENFGIVASLWTTYLDKEYPDIIILPHHVPMMMILFKIAREMFSHQEDNLTDLANYAALAQYLHEVT